MSEQTEQTEQLFIYGTLTEPVIQKAVTGREISGEPDKLSGYKKIERNMGDGIYPIIIKDAGSVVEGMVVAVSEEELNLIDRYETEAYRRVRVTLESGKETWVYSE